MSCWVFATGVACQNLQAIKPPHSSRAGRSDEATFTKATCELYCGFPPAFQLIGLIIFFIFTLWYLLLGGCCRAQEARRSRAFITATHVHYRRKRYTCGCLCGGEEVLSAPLLNVVDAISDAAWWSDMEENDDTGAFGICCTRPCCVAKVPNSDCMLLGVLHRPAGSVDRRAANKPQGGIVELPALEDPITFQQVLQAAVALRQRGLQGVREGFNDVLVDAVCGGVAPGSPEEQAAAAAMLSYDPTALVTTMMQVSKESATISRARYPKLQVGAALSTKMGLNPAMFMAQPQGGRQNQAAMMQMQQGQMQQGQMQQGQMQQGHHNPSYGANAQAPYPGTQPQGAHGGPWCIPWCPPPARHTQAVLMQVQLAHTLCSRPPPLALASSSKDAGLYMYCIVCLEFETFCNELRMHE